MDLDLDLDLDLTWICKNQTQSGASALVHYEPAAS